GQADIRVVDISSDMITLSVDWPTYPLTNPIRRRPCADPVQKQVSGERMTQKGLTNRGPLQKPG
ncbi:hypothetical protein, partial [Bradyrhizobium sp. CSA112]|uniref:hypothetical protein n=1 Tax=Bradyrhizobium sp. CSA112 TaxID=2699170 RepID=UPI0023B04022